MTGYDVDDIAFLTGDNRFAANKRAFYEPSSMSDRMRKIILSPQRVCVIAVLLFFSLIIIALIAAFARPFSSCSNSVAGPVDSHGTLPNTPSPSPTPPTATNGETFPWQSIRLPEFARPLKYELYIHPNLSSFTFEGTVNITFILMEPKQFIVLHSHQLYLPNVILITDDPIKVSKYLLYEKNQQIYVKFTGSLRPQKNYTLSIDFRGNLTKQLEGFYLSTYENSDGELRYIATTQFEPTYARSAFPCFDEPDMKAEFSLSIVRDARHHSLFNMPRVRTQEIGDGLYLDIFDKTVNMSTYLVAFIVCDFENQTTTTRNGTEVSVYSASNHIKQTQFALEVASKVLDYFHDYFDIPYPLPKQDLVAIPDFSSGAMENWGLITYRETAILFDPNETSSVMQQNVALTVTHELAHQWFGNLVTMKWWNDLWLNEGFATFMEYIGTDHIHPEWKMMDQYLVDIVQHALNLDMLASSHPISVEVEDPSSIESIFDTISYSKGSAIIYMLQNFLGADKLQMGLKKYLRAYEYSNANTSDLWNALTEENKRTGNNSVDIKMVMDTWTNQMGFPLINVSLRGNKLYATQQRFVISSPTEDAQSVESRSVYGYKWYVPLTCITNNTKVQQLIWMNMSNVEITLGAAQWIKCNINQTGFYRVTYDEDMWRSLVRLLLENFQALSAADRASLIDDAFTLARYNMLDPTIPLEMLTYLKQETEFIPWTSAIDQLGTLFSLLYERPAHTLLERYIQKLLVPIIERVKLVEAGDHLNRILQGYVLRAAVKVRNETVIQELKQRFYAWKNNGTRVSPDLRAVVYYTGVRFGTHEDWKYCWNKYSESQVPSEKLLFLQALGASQDTSTLSQYLEYALDPSKIRLQDIATVIRSIAMNPNGHLLAWRFARSHWPILNDLIGRTTFHMIYIITDITSYMTTQFDYNEAKEFFDAADVGSGKRAVQNSLEKIQANMLWLQLHESAVEKWLKHKNNETVS